MTMEKRAILAAVLMAALLILYQTLFLPPPPEPPPAEKPVAEAPRAAPPSREAPAPLPPTPPPPRPRAPEARRPPQRTATIEAPLYRATVSSEGGKLLEWTLRYRGDKPMVVLGEQGPLGLVIGQAPGAVEPVAMHLSADALTLGPERPGGELVLSGTADGLPVRQTLRFHADTFTIDALIRVENPSAAPRTASVALPWVFRQHDKPAEQKFAGQRPTEVVWSVDGSVQRIEDLTEVSRQAVAGDWVALGSTWYLAALMPRTPGITVAADGDLTKKNGLVEGQVRVAARATPTIAPGQAWEGHVTLFVGPKEYDRLRVYGLQSTLNFGGFPVPRRWGGLPMEWVGIPILRVMNWVYGYVGNYGVAIILLTIITRVLFYPLTVKSMRSMKAMQALGPQVNALRGKYRNDPRKLQEETLALYRKHKVNPMGGCLPMIAQVPIFYALYLALTVSVELQNSPFLCLGRVFGIDVWICDLAQPDPTYILPILFAVSMFVQQKMTPTAADPQQARMMMMMPIVFGGMFIIFPIASGLTLYWTVSNLLQILQQWQMNRPGKRDAARTAKESARA